MRQLALFTIGDDEFGVDIYKVVEILNPVKIFAIPDMPDFLSGVINLRGGVVPVLDLRKRFNVASNPEKERIIIVMVEGHKVGLHVDSVKEIIEFNDDEIMTPPPIFKGFKPEYLIGLGRRDERVIILLNTESILTADEKITLQESKEKLEQSIHEEH